jgi:hypothetical protein
MMNRSEQLQQYRVECDATVKTLTDEQLVEYVEAACEMAARCNAFSEYDVEASAAYEECQRRGKPELYQRGYDDAYELCTGCRPRRPS